VVSRTRRRVGQLGTYFELCSEECAMHLVTCHRSSNIVSFNCMPERLLDMSVAVGVHTQPGNMCKVPEYPEAIDAVYT